MPKKTGAGDRPQEYDSRTGRHETSVENFYLVDAMNDYYRKKERTKW